MSPAYSIIRSRDPSIPVAGEDHSYSVKDAQGRPPATGCVVSWTLNGRQARVGSTEGPLRVEGIGDVEFSVQVVSTGSVKIRAIVDCPPLGRGLVGPFSYDFYFGGEFAGLEKAEDASFSSEIGQIVNTELNAVRVSLAEVQGRLAVLSRLGLSVFPQPTTSPETNINIKDMVDDEFEGKSPSEIADALVFALRGVSKGDAELLQQAFDIKTVRDLADLEVVRFAQSIVAMAGGDRSFSAGA